MSIKMQQNKRFIKCGWSLEQKKGLISKWLEMHHADFVTTIAVRKLKTAEIIYQLWMKFIAMINWVIC